MSSDQQVPNLVVPGKSVIMSQEEALQRAKRKRGESSAGGSIDTTTHRAENSPSRTLSNREEVRIPRTRSSVPVEAVIIPDTHDVSFPPDFLAGESTSNGIWPEAQKLLFPVAAKRLASLDGYLALADGAQLVLQGFQNILYSKSQLGGLERKLLESDKAKKMLQLQVEAAKKKVEDVNLHLEGRQKHFEEEMKKKEDALRAKDEELSKKDKEAEDLYKKLVDLEDENKNIEAEVTLRIKAYLANSFLLKKFEGDAGVKKLRQLVDDYLTVGYIRDLASGEADPGEPEATKSTAESSPSHQLESPPRRIEEDVQLPDA